MSTENTAVPDPPDTESSAKADSLRRLVRLADRWHAMGEGLIQRHYNERAKGNERGAQVFLRESREAFEDARTLRALLKLNSSAGSKRAI